MHFEFCNRGGGVFFLGILYVVEPEQQPKKIENKNKNKNKWVYPFSSAMRTHFRDIHT